MFERYIRYAGYLLGRVADKLQNQRRINGVWIDVGSHLGEFTFNPAQRNPSLMVYAFEPNLSVALQRVGTLPNFVMIPFAVAEQDGAADFYVNAYEASSSLLRLDPVGVKNWIGGEDLKETKKVTVPTIRLDTFMNAVKIKQVDYLKIDAQGADFAVVKSAGDRIRDIVKIKLEVTVTPVQCYEGASTKEEILAYLAENGFKLTETELQTYDQEENLTFERI
jgi:FkbM family methyltransferase